MHMVVRVTSRCAGEIWSIGPSPSYCVYRYRALGLRGCTTATTSHCIPARLMVLVLQLTLVSRQHASTYVPPQAGSFPGHVCRRGGVSWPLTSLACFAYQRHNWYRHSRQQGVSSGNLESKTHSLKWHSKGYLCDFSGSIRRTESVSRYGNPTSRHRHAEYDTLWYAWMDAMRNMG
jgi:hypothetical protein